LLLALAARGVCGCVDRALVSRYNDPTLLERMQELEVYVSSITVALPEDRLVKLNEMARQLGIVPEELVRVSIEELLSRPEADFEQAVDYVLAKNAELYRRLA
jgi:hypothetical protein